MSPGTIADPVPDKIDVPQRALRRLTLELAIIITLKISVLMLLWWFVFAPQPKPDVSPATMAQLLAPSSVSASEAHP